MSRNLRSISPSARSTSSTASTSSADTIRSMYGVELAHTFDASILDCLDDDVLLEPSSAFANVCLTSVNGGYAYSYSHSRGGSCSSGSSPSSSPPPSPSDARRSLWVHNGLAPSYSDDDSEDGDDDDFYSSEIETDVGAYSSLDKIAPWENESYRSVSLINFRRSSVASTIVPIELPASKPTKSIKSAKVKATKSKAQLKAEAQAEDDRAVLAYMQLHPDMDMLSMMVMARDPNAPPKPKKVKPVSDAPSGGKRRFFGLGKRQ